jgi:hypothetical protein
MVLKLGHFGRVDQKYMGSFEMWCWRKVEKISCTDRVRNKVLQSKGEEQYPMHNKKGRLTGLVTSYKETTF